jgi:rhodanese-related sulfurtransferase
MPVATAGITEIDAPTLKQWLDNGEAVLIDVREPDEHARERIAAATLHPLSTLDPVVLAATSDGTRRLVLHCKGGRRSMEAANRLVQAAPCEVYSLQRGLEGWKAAGLPTVLDTKAPLPIMRQVQITVGFAVLATSVLAATVSPWFLALTGFFGAGLLFAGATGICGLAAVLGAMPWNRIETKNAGARPTTPATRSCGCGGLGGRGGGGSCGR